MVYVFHIDAYELCAKDNELEINKKINNMIDELEEIIRDAYSVAKDISHTGESLVGEEWEARLYGRAYELYNGAVFVDLVHSADDEMAYVEGKVVLIGHEGFSGGESTLSKNIRSYFRQRDVRINEAEFY